MSRSGTGSGTAFRRPGLHLPFLLIAAALLSVPASAGAVAPIAPAWNHPAVMESRDGYAQLSWGLPPGDDLLGEIDWIYHLQEGRQPVFDETDVQYMGPQHSSFVSGLEDGAYYYRVRARHPDEDEWGEWSAIVRVDVQHHSRRLALTLMSIGGIVFLATAGFLLHHRNDPVPSGAPGGPGA